MPRGPSPASSHRPPCSGGDEGGVPGRGPGQRDRRGGHHDDEAAKRSVTELLDSIGYDAYDVGPLSEGWRYQRDTAAYVQPYAVPGTEYPTWPGRQVTPEMLEEKLDAAVRYRDT